MDEYFNHDVDALCVAQDKLERVIIGPKSRGYVVNFLSHMDTASSSNRFDPDNPYHTERLLKFFDKAERRAVDAAFQDIYGKGFF